MKKLNIFCILLIMIVTGCSAPALDNSLGSSRVSLNDQYRTYFEENSIRTVLIDSFKEFEAFLQKHQPVAGDVKASSLLGLYNEEFFKHNVVYAQFLEIGSGSTKVTAEKTKVEDGILKLIVKTKTPNIATMDIVYWVCLFGLDREKAKDVQQVEVVVDNKIIPDSDSSTISDERRIQFQTSLETDYDFDNNSPIFLKTYEEFKTFISDHKPTLDIDLSELFNDEYFKTHGVYAQTLMVYSGSIKVVAREHQVVDGALRLIVDYFVPENYTDDIAFWVVMFGVEKELAEIESVEVVIEELQTR